MENIEDIMIQLDPWVSKRGSGNYLEDRQEMGDYGLPEDYGIQQIKEEIKEFIKVLLKRKPKIILEIGLGYYGSTHFLWRLLANHVATIEKNHERILAFGRNTREYYRKWILNDGRSSFFFGYSYEPSVVKRVYDTLKNGVDVLFIDGDHTYKGVMTDWLLYEPLVKSGGIVAFHDLNLSYNDGKGGPCDFINALIRGDINGRLYKLNEIEHSRYIGIGFYIKE
jgi:cephalosporin hydroxylase